MARRARNLLERLRRHDVTYQDALEAAQALELARELFVLAVSKTQMNTEARERLKATVHCPEPAALVRARHRHERVRAAAIEEFNKALGLC